MYQEQINTILKHFTDIFEINFLPGKTLFASEDLSPDEFLKSLKKTGEKFGVLIIENEISLSHFSKTLSANNFPVVYFSEIDGKVYPVIDGRHLRNGNKYTYCITTDGKRREGDFFPVEQGSKIKIITAFPLQSISEESREFQTAANPLTPMQRLIRMLRVEKRDIISIYIYALLIGVISLVLPLGIQTIIGMVQGGVVFSSIYILIGLVIAALIISGVLQIIQVVMVEYLQERLFAKAAFDFTFRIPRIRAESFFDYYPPALLNRFFDITTVQKALPKVLIDITTAVIQIIFGLLLLAAYHPLFIGLSFITVLVFYIIAKFYSNATLKANIVKSKYKYKIAEWLQDVARLHYSFKVSGGNRFPLDKTEQLLNSYFKYQKKYFESLLIILYNAVFFKAFVSGGLLIVGTYLVIDGQITIGQFVASEIIIVLVVSSIEKILLSVDSIFDLLTAVDKLGDVADLPLETNQGTIKHLRFSETAINLKTNGLVFKFEDLPKATIDGLSMEIPSNQHTCIAGLNGSGKETLLNVLSGIFTSYQGSITLNGISLRDIERDHLHETIERNVSQEGIFDGTLLENITLNRNNVSMEDVYWVLEKLQLLEYVAQLKNGLSTHMISGGRRFSKSFITKITLARCIVNRPKLLMISDCYENFDNSYIAELVSFVTDKTNPWTLITVSNDPKVMQACDMVYVLDKGKLIEQGAYSEISHSPVLQRCVR